MSPTLLASVSFPLVFWFSYAGQGGRIRMSAWTGRGMIDNVSSSSDQTSIKLRERETPKSCISSVNISGSDSSGIKCFL